MKELNIQDFKDEEIVLDNSTIDLIKKVYFGSAIETTKDKIYHIIEWFVQCIDETKKELSNVFAFEEINFLVTSYSNTLYGAGYSIKQFLKLKMYYEYIHNDIPKNIENVNLDEFMERLEGLTEFQSFVLTYVVMEFADKHTIYTKEDIMKLFDIK